MRQAIPGNACVAVARQRVDNCIVHSGSWKKIGGRWDGNFGRKVRIAARAPRLGKSLSLSSDLKEAATSKGDIEESSNGWATRIGGG